MQFLAALRQAQHFLDVNASTLGTVNTTGARKTLDATIDTIAGLAERQDSHRIQVTGERTNELRLAEALRRRYVRPIVEIAKQKLPEVAQLSNVTLPPANSNSTVLVSRALGIADAAQPHAQLFIDAGLPVDFVDRLRAAAGRVVAAIAGKGEHRSRRVGATDGLAKEVRAARRAVKVLDAFVRAELGRTEPLVSEWRNAVRVIRGGSAHAQHTVTSAAAAHPVTPAVPASGAVPEAGSVASSA